MPGRPLLGLLLLLAAVTAGLLLLTAASCSRQPPPTKPNPLADLIAEYGQPVKTYTVRAEVEQVPDPEILTSELRLHHEAIDDWVGKSGDVVGMGAMTMPFPLADGLELPDGLKPGDKVEVAIAHWIDPLVRYIAYEIERLPDDTELVYRPKRPPEQPD